MYSLVKNWKHLLVDSIRTYMNVVLFFLQLLQTLNYKRKKKKHYMWLQKLFLLQRASFINGLKQQNQEFNSPWQNAKKSWLKPLERQPFYVQLPLCTIIQNLCFFLHNNILTNVLYDIWMQYMLSIAGICYKAFQLSGSNKTSGSHTSVQGLKEDLDSGGTQRSDVAVQWGPEITLKTHIKEFLWYWDI